MSGINSAMNVALSGIELFETGIETVSNNLANVSTTGYSSESVNSLEVSAGSNVPGNGVEAPEIVRAVSAFAAAQLRGANSASQAASAQSTELTNISNALTDNGNIQSAMNQFFNDVSTLSANPESTAQAATVLADAQSVAGAFNSAAGSVTTSMQDSMASIQTNVTAANNLLTQLAQINSALTQAPNSPSLLDQQQGALNSLSTLLPVSVIPQTNGTVIVANGGAILLDQSGAQALSIQEDADGAPSISAGADDTPLHLASTDGTIGGSIANWNAGSSAMHGLNALANIFANMVNTAQAQGLTASGTPGQALFSVQSPTVSANPNNTGSASVTVSSVNTAQLPTDGGPFLLTYSTTNGWIATDQSTGQSYTPSGTPPAFAGMTLNITGAPANGDAFLIDPAPNAATGMQVVTNSANAIAAADPYAATPGTLQTDGSILNENAGQISTGSDIVTTTPPTGAAVIPASYYGQNLQLVFTSSTSYNVETAGASPSIISSGTFSATGGNLCVAYPSTGAAAGQYWQLPITGTPDTGDVLTLTPGGASSGSNAARMAALWTAGGTTAQGSLQQAVIGFSSSLGAQAQQAQALSAETAGQVTTATDNLQTVSGVNSDQQAVVLTNYQQAYQAAAQVISAAHTMFESLVEAI